MKRTLYILSIAVFAFACGSSTSTENAQDTTSVAIDTVAHAIDTVATESNDPADTKK